MIREKRFDVEVITQAPAIANVSYAHDTFGWLYRKLQIKALATVKT